MEGGRKQRVDSVKQCSSRAEDKELAHSAGGRGGGGRADAEGCGVTALSWEGQMGGGGWAAAFSDQQDNIMLHLALSPTLS